MTVSLFSVATLLADTNGVQSSARLYAKSLASEYVMLP